LERGHEVTAVARDREKLPSHAALHAHHVDVYDPDQLARLIRGHAAVISAFNPGWNNADIYNLQLKAPEPLSMGSRKPA
jgi:putative NADH-flavin reductase